MKRKTGNIKSITRLFLFMLCLLCVTGCKKEPAIIESGTIGDLTWTLNEKGTLTISGKGEMPDYVPDMLPSSYGYYYYPYTPWYYYRADITRVIIGNNVSRVGNYAFADCPNLTSVTIGNSVTFIGTFAFAECSGLTSVTIPNSVTSIERYAFYGCSGLTSVTIPNSVTSIENYAFCVCISLTYVTIPNSVTRIGMGAFQGCTSLTEVINENVTPQDIGANVFISTNISACTLRVPASSIDAYNEAKVWKNFGKIEAI